MCSEASVFRKCFSLNAPTFDIQNARDMTSKFESKAEESRISDKIKNFMLMVVIILICMVMQANQANAADFNRESQKRSKQQYKKQNHAYSNACHVLKLKRTQSQNFVVKGGRHVLKYR